MYFQPLENEPIFEHVLEPKYLYKYNNLKSFHQHRNIYCCLLCLCACHVVIVWPHPQIFDHTHKYLYLLFVLIFSSVKYWTLKKYQPYVIQSYCFIFFNFWYLIKKVCKITLGNLYCLLTVLHSGYVYSNWHYFLQTNI